MASSLNETFLQGIISGIRHLVLDICFDEYDYHDSLQARLREGISHSYLFWYNTTMPKNRLSEFVPLCHPIR